MCSSFNTNRIIQKIKLIEIHTQDFLFGVVTFKLHRNHPFNRFLEKTLQCISRHIFCKQLFGKLLRQSTTSTCIFLKHQTTFHKRTEQCFGINSRMFNKTDIFRRNKSIDNTGRQILVSCIYPIFLTIRPRTKHFFIFRKNLRCKFIARILKFLHRRHIANPPL